MESHSKRNIQSGERYTHLFPVAKNSTATIRKDANVYHTVAFIPKVVNETLLDTKKLAAILKGATLYKTCSNIWQFVYDHIAYKKDEDGYEQIRSPARAWHDRFRGVDCDCYSVFISSILTNLNIPHSLRITKYQRAYFQHIYPIVPTASGHIAIDCVTEKFDYEVPFSEKKDYPMDLQYLNGFDGNPALYADPNDAYFADSGMGAFGKIIQQRFSAQRKRTVPMKKNPGMPMKPKAGITKAPMPSPTIKKAKGFKKVINKVNKVNPATLALRNGILASMKLNIKNVSGRLRWSYLSPQDAIKKGIDAFKFQRLIATRQKLENIFYKCGGKPENLRKSILSGKGNKDKAVNGLEGFDGMAEYLNEFTPMDQLLGQEIYHSENIEGMEGLGQLGEPLTLTSIAAASGVIAGIAGMLKQIGDIFQKKTKGSQDFDEKKNDEAEKETVTPSPVAPPPLPIPSNDFVKNTLPIEDMVVRPVPLPSVMLPQNQPVPMAVQNNGSNEETVVTNNAVMEQENKQDSMMVSKPDADKTDNTNNGEEGFWDKHKKWLKPAVIGVGGVTLLAIGIKMMQPHGNNTQKRTTAKSLNGPSKYKKNYRRKSKPYSRKKTAVALM